MCVYVHNMLITDLKTDDITSHQSLRSSFQDCFEKGEYIIREGEEGNTFFIISKGEVRYLHCFAMHVLL